MTARTGWKRRKKSDNLKYMTQASTDYQRIEKALCYIDSVFPAQPPLAEIARHTGLSEFHFQKLFQRWVGISPKRFLQFITKDHSLRILKESRSILDAALDAGLSGPGRLHDLLVECDAMTPGEIKSGGRNLVIRYGTTTSPFGLCMLAITDRGICRLEFIETRKDEKRIQNQWKQDFPEATFREDVVAADEMTLQIFGGKKADALSVLLNGTNFQIQVWQALLRIPSGSVLSYEDVAQMIGRPEATRAVASAIAHNRIAFLIPCHRVIRKMGVIHKYHYGTTRKKAMLGWEAGMKRPSLRNTQEEE
ncbi:MAG TPA: methylated-DNA--[protein]-cysteine S-methyltransferase [Leptospiraceae bacterium]|nr:methylated-DNA--[protein]-cysteine S-methyltransferase [Leptospiraceae bacterium]HMX56307.1 methylated-DNA--[protein]-cysteine S-methyltransferase [Leptospiraceae bacterium]